MSLRVSAWSACGAAGGIGWGRVVLSDGTDTGAPSDSATRPARADAPVHGRHAVPSCPRPLLPRPAGRR